MNYSILNKIIADLEVLEKEKSPRPIKMEDFVFFLNQKYLAETVTEKTVSTDHGHETIENQISQLVAFLYRHAKGYIKKALESSSLLTLDDFGYLATVWKHGDLTKTQVIEQNIHEKNTGMEILKRLISNNFLEQYDDTIDKRSKRLKITALGQTELLKTFENMFKVSQIISGKLSLSEKMQLYYLLDKLHDFHNPIFLNEKDTNIDGLLEKYF
jgi:DNA-binding MarR family transcriptional regulator